MTISGISSPLSASAINTTPTENSTPSEIETRSHQNEKIYQSIFSMITERYKDFRPGTEIGFQQTPGVTADIEPILKPDLIAILEHIKSSDDLLDTCKKNSAKAPFFNKFYLMANPEQGWNLRLHSFDVRGSGLGEEDSPHYHRWILASKILTGGYINVNYQESPKTDLSLERDTYSKYSINASKSQVSNEARQAKYISEAVMTPINRTLYAQGDLKHFPKAIPHSVETHSAIMGTTITLAHTSKAVVDTTFTFKRNNNAEAFPEIKIENNETFKHMLQNQITHLQVLVLSDDLNNLLSSKFEQDTPLTSGEGKHFQDYKEPNYVETSLLPALAIYQMESLNNVEHIEFSKEAIDIIDAALIEIDSDALNALISSNQSDLFDKQLTIEIDDIELAKQFEERAAQRAAFS